MTWSSTPSRYLRRGPTNWTGADIGIGVGMSNLGWEPDTSACWYEQSYGTSGSTYLSLLTVHYKFVPGPPVSGWPAGLASDVVCVNLPMYGKNLGARTIVGHWYASTWWGWGGDGLVELDTSAQYLRLLVRDYTKTQNSTNDKWLNTNETGNGYVSGLLHQTESSIYMNIQYEV